MGQNPSRAWPCVARVNFGEVILRDGTQGGGNCGLEHGPLNNNLEQPASKC